MEDAHKRWRECNELLTQKSENKQLIRELGELKDSQCSELQSLREKNNQLMKSIADLEMIAKITVQE